MKTPAKIPGKLLLQITRYGTGLTQDVINIDNGGSPSYALGIFQLDSTVVISGFRCVYKPRQHQLLFSCLQSYDFSYCNYSRASYCYPNNYGNVSKKVHQFEVAVLAGYTYSVNVYAVTPFGRGSYANVKHTVPPLSVRVSSVYSYVSGNYGLQLYIHWYWYYSYTYPNVVRCLIFVN